VDDDHRAASAGYAIVLSRAEGKVAFIDLEPLFQYFRTMYFTTPENFALTQNEGDAPDQWPFAFSFAPEATPVVQEVLDVSQPTSVATGFDVGDRAYDDPDFGNKAFVATLDGALHIYDVAGLAQGGPGSASLADTVDLCHNPVAVAYGRGNVPRDELVFVCRGDRELRWVASDGTTKRALRDRRLIDPVGAVLVDSRGAGAVSVADFDGRQVVNYLHAPIDSWGEDLFGGLGEDGQAEFEFVGSLERPGQVFELSAAEVN
jgi:hypothetical protein